MHLGKCQGLIKQKKSMGDSYMRKNDKKQTEPTFLKIIYFKFEIVFFILFFVKYTYNYRKEVILK